MTSMKEDLRIKKQATRCPASRHSSCSRSAVNTRDERANLCGIGSAQSVIVAIITTLMLVALRGVAAQTTPASERRAEPPQSVRLYVFDCGTLHIPDVERFHLKKARK